VTAAIACSDSASDFSAVGFAGGGASSGVGFDAGSSGGLSSGLSSTTRDAGSALPPSIPCGSDAGADADAQADAGHDGGVPSDDCRGRFVLQCDDPTSASEYVLGSCTPSHVCAIVGRSLRTCSGGCFHQLDAGIRCIE
jgi:hypothetical protein